MNSNSTCIRANVSALPIDPAPTRADDLRARLRGPGLSLAWFCMGSVALIEIGGRQGCDAAVIDLQHGLWDPLSAHLAVSALGDVPVIARVAGIDTIGAALDSGATGVIVPLIESADQARRAVAMAQFPPAGIRSGGGVRPLSSGFAAYVRGHAQPLIGVMIETVEGVANVAAIAATPGLDYIFIGTGDLALSIGCFPVVDERLDTACTTIRAACDSADLPCGIFTTTADAARIRAAQGYAVTVSANDIAIVAQGFAAAHTESTTKQGRK